MPRRPIITREFLPRLDIGDLVMLFDGSGVTPGNEGGTPLFEVRAWEQIPLLGQHGAILLWTQANAAPAGYALLGGEASGSIAAGASKTATPNALNMSNRDLFQFRVLFKHLGALPGGFVVDDVDIQFRLPGAVQRWTLLNAQGVMNAMAQYPLPGDVAELPDQAANIALPTLYPLEDAFDAAHKTEAWCFENNPPAFTIFNNGAVSMNSAGHCVAALISGFRYNLQPYDPNDAPLVPRSVAGFPVKVTADVNLRTDVTYVQIGGRPPGQ